MSSDIGERWDPPLRAVGSGHWRPGPARTLARMQSEAMRRHFPGLKLILDLPWISIWEGELRPVSETYRVRVLHQRGFDDGLIVFTARWPTVRVISPALSRRSGALDQPVPHLYGPHDHPLGPELCLFYPTDREWTEHMLIAESIVPWAVEWLFYYEMWHVTGKWGGEEAPHYLAAGSNGAVKGDQGLSEKATRYIKAPLMRSMAYLLYGAA